MEGSISKPLATKKLPSPKMTHHQAKQMIHHETRTKTTRKQLNPPRPLLEKILMLLLHCAMQEAGVLRRPASNFRFSGECRRPGEVCVGRRFLWLTSNYVCDLAGFYIVQKGVSSHKVTQTLHTEADLPIDRTSILFNHAVATFVNTRLRGPVCVCVCHPRSDQSHQDADGSITGS